MFVSCGCCEDLLCQSSARRIVSSVWVIVLSDDCFHLPQATSSWTTDMAACVKGWFSTSWQSSCGAQPRAEEAPSRPVLVHRPPAEPLPGHADGPAGEELHKLYDEEAELGLGQC